MDGEGMHENEIEIGGLDKAELLKALYDNARAQGMGVLQMQAGGIKIEQAQMIIEKCGDNLYFDYLFGRVMKVDLSGDSMDTRLYDRDNGQGSAKAIIDQLMANSANIPDTS